VCEECGGLIERDGEHRCVRAARLGQVAPGPGPCSPDTTTSTEPAQRGQEPTRQRSQLRAVAIPSEHGGWGLTAEPVLLGLLVAPGIAGGALGAAAVVAFLARTPLKVVLVDRWRHRHLPRTGLAIRVLLIEAVVLAALVALAAVRGGGSWWEPMLAAAPLVAVQLWFDMRSRSRRLLPELCGATGIASVAAVIARAGGRGWAVAFGLWIVLGARDIASIPFARAQVQRVKGHAVPTRESDLAQLAATVLVVAAWAADLLPWIAAVAVVVVSVGQLFWVRARPPRVRVLGIAQLLVGLAITLITAAAIRYR